MFVVKPISYIQLASIRFSYFIEQQGCIPNPCKHGGECTYSRSNTVSCNCDQKRYTGDLCNTLVIDVPKIPAMVVNSPTTVSISAWPDRAIILNITADSAVKVIPSSVMFTGVVTNRDISVMAKDQGLHKLEFTIDDPTVDYKPIPPAVVFASKNQGCSRRRGNILTPGCCQATEVELGLKFECPSSGGKVVLTSTCGWITNNVPYSGGVIFSSNNGFNMPIAITGAKFQSKENYIDLGGINFRDTCTVCNTNGGSNHTCNNTFTAVKDVQCYLHHDSLAFTYLKTSTSVIPKWLKIDVLQGTHSHDIHRYMVKLVHSDSLNTIEECKFMTKTFEGLHSVLIYTGILEVELNRQIRQILPGTSPVCFAINICEAANTPFYLSIPDHAQSVVESYNFMHELKIRRWSVKFQSIAMSSSAMTAITHQVSQQLHWNGLAFILSKQPTIHMVANIQFSKTMLNRGAITNLTFSGDMYLSHDNFDEVSCHT